MEELMKDIPDTVDLFLAFVPSPNELPPSFVLLLSKCAVSFFSKDYQRCVELSEPLLDFVWEKLNTGHWKDVHISWRYAYTIISLVKGLSLFHLLQKYEKSKATIFEAVLKTFDIGLLMGAPVLDNILARLSTEVHKSCGSMVLGSEASPCCNDRDVTIQGANTPQSSEVRDCDYMISQEGEDSHRHQHVHLISLEDEKHGTSILQSVSGVSCPKQRKIEYGKKLEEIKKVSCPSLEMFKKYYDSKEPVILTDCMLHWPAISNRMWSLDYLKSIAGYRTVPIEIGSKYTDDSWSQKLMTVRDFIQEYVENTADGKPVGYLAQHQLFDQIPELRNDIVIPDYCWIGQVQDEVDINAWFGPKGTVSPLHYDPKHNFLAQVVGQKYVELYSEGMSEYLYPHSGLMENTSHIDVENPDVSEFPLYRKATGYQGILGPGEMLYIPQKCWHFVKSLSVSLSVSFWWT